MQNVFLIGLSGSGKSTVGGILAERLGKPLIDIDALIEKECAKPISTIFSQHGEDYFRSCESRIFTHI
ncbi:MAG: shikimate kinase, partial [Ktedonobacteraceae bacterium]